MPEPLDQLDTQATRRRVLGAGQALFNQGDKTRGLFYLVDGAEELRRVTEAGHVVVMFRAATGDMLAELSFHDAYHCDAIAVESFEVIECSRKALLERYRTDINFALAMSERFGL